MSLVSLIKKKVWTDIFIITNTFKQFFYINVILLLLLKKI